MGATITQYQPAVWAEIDLDAIAHNVSELRRVTHPSARLMAVVKADGYGHGAASTARTAIENGASDLGVARIEEGLALRKQGITAPILIFGETPACRAEVLVSHHLTQAVSSLESARALSAAATKVRRRIPIHIKIDTGMGRLGLLCDALRESNAIPAAAEVLQVANLPGLMLQGIFTHFASADHADTRSAQQQLERFKGLLAHLDAAGCRIPLRHAANSAAILQLPEAHLDMVRAGIAVYGLYPSSVMDQASVALKPALTLKARVIHLKPVPAGTPISYGGTHITPRATTIATISAGYADGYRRALSNRGAVLVGGRRAPIVGRICMDLTMIDVGGIPGVKLGDEAVLIGSQGGTAIRADELAGTLATIHYEVLSAITARVERIYTHHRSGGKGYQG